MDKEKPKDRYQRTKDIATVPRYKLNSTNGKKLQELSSPRNC